MVLHGSQGRYGAASIRDTRHLELTSVSPRSQGHLRCRYVPEGLDWGKMCVHLRSKHGSAGLHESTVVAVVRERRSSAKDLLSSAYLDLGQLAMAQVPSALSD